MFLQDSTKNNLLQVLFLLLPLVSSESCFTVRWAPPFLNKKFVTGRKLSSITSTTIYHCYTKCFNTFGCVALNFSPENSTHSASCELLDVTRHYAISNFISTQHWTYIERESESCETTPCSPGVRCLASYQGNTRTCIDNEGHICQYHANSGDKSNGMREMMWSGSLMSVYCDQTSGTGGWLVIQRNDGSGGFDKTWNEYKAGFGDAINGSFWFGNEKMHNLTWDTTTTWELRVDLTQTNGTQGYAQYTGFKLSGEDDGYRLHLDQSYTGTIGDAMFPSHQPHKAVGRLFSTKDRDQDTYSGSCALNRGWWYAWCSLSDLNAPSAKWNSLRGKLAVMKIRPVTAS